jgi:hypothetical protein
MARIERNVPDVYNEPHLFDPPSSVHNQEHIDDEEEEDAPMLPTATTAVTVLNNNYNNTTYIRGPNNTLKIIFLTLCLAG